MIQANTMQPQWDYSSRVLRTKESLQYILAKRSKCRLDTLKTVFLMSGPLTVSVTKIHHPGP